MHLTWALSVSVTDSHMPSSTYLAWWGWLSHLGLHWWEPQGSPQCASEEMPSWAGRLPPLQECPAECLQIQKELSWRKQYPQGPQHSWVQRTRCPEGCFRTELKSLRQFKWRKCETESYTETSYLCSCQCSFVICITGQCRGKSLFKPQEQERLQPLSKRNYCNPKKYMRRQAPRNVFGCIQATNWAVSTLPLLSWYFCFNHYLFPQEQLDTLRYMHKAPIHFYRPNPFKYTKK